MWQLWKLHDMRKRRQPVCRAAGGARGGVARAPLPARAKDTPALARVHYSAHTSWLALPTWQGGGIQCLPNMPVWFPGVFWSFSEDGLFQAFGFVESHSTIFCLLLL